MKFQVKIQAEVKGVKMLAEALDLDKEEISEARRALVSQVKYFAIDVDEKIKDIIVKEQVKPCRNAENDNTDYAGAPATQKQINMMRHLGVPEDYFTNDLSVTQASEIIKQFRQNH